MAREAARAAARAVVALVVVEDVPQAERAGGSVEAVEASWAVVGGRAVAAEAAATEAAAAVAVEADRILLDCRSPHLQAQARGGHVYDAGKQDIGPFLRCNLQSVPRAQDA